MMRGALAASLCGLFVVCSVVGAVQSDPKQERSVFKDTEGSFELVGRDRRSIEFMKDLSASVESVCRRLLGDKERGYPALIFVTLQPEDEANFETNYRVSLLDRMLVQVDFKWNESLSLEQACLGLTEGYLARHIYYRRGAGAAADVPDWLVSALAYQVYLQLRPAVSVALVERLRGQEVPRLESVLGGGDGNVEDLWGYWLLSGLRRSPAFTQMARSALEGGDTYAAFTQLLNQSNAPGAEAVSPEAWWELILEDLMATDLQIFETLEESRTWIELLANVEGITLSNGKELNNLKDLWPNRGEEDLQQLVRARREIVLLRINQVNLAYYNTALSLGALYESILESDLPSENIAGLIDYLGEMNDAKRLEQAVREALEQ